VDIKSDIASLHARRIMLELIEKEQLEQAEQVKAGSRSTVRLGVEQ
jgi:hypothetical protein